MNVAQNMAFYAIAALMVGAAIRVVTTRNIVHAALYLVLVLAGVAAQYILLTAEFIGVVQVLVYIGAIIVLFLFGIMLTRAPLGNSLEVDRKQAVMGLVVAGTLMALLGYVLVDGFDDTKIDLESPAAAEEIEVDEVTDANIDDEADLDRDEGAAFGNTEQVSDSIFSDYLVPFEAVSVLLLAALIGAIVLARRD